MLNEFGVGFGVVCPRISSSNGKDIIMIITIKTFEGAVFDSYHMKIHTDDQKVLLASINFDRKEELVDFLMKTDLVSKARSLR